MTTLNKIIPHIKALEPLLANEEITDIFVNEEGDVHYATNGLIFAYPSVMISERDRINAITNIVRLIGGEIEPLITARLEGGHRVTAVLKPNAVNGTIIAIRKFRKERLTARQLVELGMLTFGMLNVLTNAVEKCKNILISGGTGCGKTTLLNALAASIPKHERIILIEDTAEIEISNPHVVHLEATKEMPDRKEVTIRDLVKQSLRLQPSRLILGETRGAEAFDLLQAMNTGHKGTISTIHADSAEETLPRLHTCVAIAGVDIPYEVFRQMIRKSIDVIVYLEKAPTGHRSVKEIHWNKEDQK